MKISTKITAALIALGIVARAGADPVVYLTGSTAFRSTVEAALIAGGGTNSGGVFDAAPNYTTFGNASASGATYMIFHGNINGSPVYINCAWSGSEAGIASACNTSLANIIDNSGDTVPLAGSPETWICATNSAVVSLISGNTVISTNPASGSVLYETSAQHVNGVGADFSQADTSQAISWTPAVAGTQTALTDYGTEAAVAFTVSRNNQPAPTREWLDCTNITLPQLNVLLANGSAPAGFISGNTNDNDMNIYLVGRNMGSGTRMNMLGDSTYGAQRPVQQYSIGGGVAAGSTHQDTLLLNLENNNGYESGGDVAKALGITNSTTGSCQQTDPGQPSNSGWFAVGYVAPSDALNTANWGGAPVSNWVTVDGVLSSDGAIENGQWWLWGHEHLYARQGITLGSGNTYDLVGKRIVTAVKLNMGILGWGTNPAAHDAGIPISLLNVSKPSDVSFPTF